MFNKCKVKKQKPAIYNFSYFGLCFVCSHHQQRVQPSFSSPVLSSPLPVKVSSLSKKHSSKASFHHDSIMLSSLYDLKFQALNLISVILKALPSHPLHTGSTTHDDVCWPASVQQHAAVNHVHSLLTDRAALRTVHLRYR